MIRMVIGALMFVIGLVRDIGLRLENPDSLSARIFVDNSGDVILNYVLVIGGILIFLWGIKRWAEK